VHHSAGKVHQDNIENYGAIYLPFKASQEVEDQEVFEAFRRQQRQLRLNKSPQQQSKSSPLTKLVKKSRFEEELDDLAARIADARMFLEEMSMDINMELMVQ
jgi:hypothetical protein